jgi:hypothetical protein
MQQIEDTPDNTIKEADSNEIQKASFLSWFILQKWPFQL